MAKAFSLYERSPSPLALWRVFAVKAVRLLDIWHVVMRICQHVAELRYKFVCL